VEEEYAYAEMDKPMNKPEQEQEKDKKQVRFTRLPEEHLGLLRVSRFEEQEQEVKRKRRRSKEVVRQLR
jgi:hypothetical protein